MNLIKKPIVIVGSGFGGINAALNLKKIDSSLPVLVIDSQSQFNFKPLLYEVLSNEIQSWEVAPYFENIFSEASIAFLKNEVTLINLEESFLKLKDNLVVEFDYLIIATGSSPNNFSIKGVEENCYFFNNNEDQRKLKDYLDKSFNDNIKKDLFIIGGGPSGVELACKIYDTYEKRFKINIIESEGGILGKSKTYNREEAEKAIQLREINLLLNTTVQEISTNQIKIYNKLGQNFKKHDAVIWTAGVKPNITMFSHDIKKINNRIVVNKMLQLTHFENVFAIGDVAIVEKDSNLPITAQVAMQQGKHVADNLHSLINKFTLLPFEFKDNGEMISLGIGEASISGLGLTLSGKMAFELRRLIYASKMPLFVRSIKSTASWFLSKKSILKKLIFKE